MLCVICGDPSEDLLCDKCVKEIKENEKEMKRAINEDD